MKGRLPCPVIFTVKVPAELAASWSAESDASMENLPTAPVKLAGARRELFDRDVHAGRLQFAPQVIDFVPAAEERIDVAAALHDNLCNSVIVAGSITSVPACCG